MLFSYSRGGRRGPALRHHASEVRGRDAIPRGAGMTTPAHHRGRRAGCSWTRRRRGVAAAGADRPISTSTDGPVVVERTRPGGRRGLPRRRDRARARPDGRLAVTTASAPAPTALGTPARPIVHDGEVFAAWLPEGEHARDAVELGGRAVGAGLRREDARPISVAPPSWPPTTRSSSTRRAAAGCGRCPTGAAGPVEPGLVAR